ncbi:DUF6603 domain-containing protein [Spongiactinospora sp. TRM90649]|uniref:DUF6603 domain-containing protein n=1 Tax=Spongiactinospora sp. TRM90649 TaxID=3031114 RepID=UPI0023F837CB|nr:DUF6603 domain-containing protein [Spongiactinospora sp. TRM90649]MDF5753245.1 hypothetical protein [Spongiactinospora sp. TRM90649]
MADGSGKALAAALRGALVTALGRIVGELQEAASFNGLGSAGPEWEGTALAGKLLAPLGDIPVNDPLAALTLRGLRALTGGADGLGAELHGWKSDGVPGIAYAARTGGGFAFAVHVTGTGADVRVGLTASGAQPDAVAADLAEGWTMTVTGLADGVFDMSMGADGSVDPGSTTDGGFLRVEFTRPDQGRRYGVPGGPGVRLGAIVFGGEVRAEAGALRRHGWARNTGGSVELVPGGLSALLGGLGPLPLAMDLGMDPDQGISLLGNPALTVRLPVARAAPGLRLDGLDIAFRLDPPSGTSVTLTVGVRTAVTLSLPGAPVTMRFEGLGLELPFAFGDVPVPGIGDQIAPLAPTGAGVRLDLPVVKGSGFLIGRGEGEYAGGISAAIPPMSVTAFGVLGMSPPSFIAILGATFPPPGIQIGFGFAVSGIGGVVGVNRRVDRDALLRAVENGTAAALLFPADPAAAADAVGRALPEIFPAARGWVVAGPMFQVSWGGRLVTASVAVLVEIGARQRLTVLGKLVMAIPDPLAPLILIQVTFAGQFDPGEPSVLIVASMTGSHIVGVPLTGDVCLLTRGGADPEFVLSAGGFHPAFTPPRGVPPLQRIGTDMSPLPFLELRCEAYLALTTNTLQFGARLELVAQVAKCGIRGHLSLDLLLQFEPLHFIADVSVGVALTVFGEDLVGVALSLRLEGPAPWHARGRGEVDLFLFSVPFSFDETWGALPPAPLAARDVGQELKRALESPGAWTAHRRADAPAVLVLTGEADQRVARGDLVDPYGAITVRQSVVPFGIDIDRFERVPLAARQRWDIADPQLGDRPARHQNDVRDRFAPAQFLGMSDDQQLARPSFEYYKSGFDLSGEAVEFPPMVEHTIGFETSVFADEISPPEILASRLVQNMDVLLAAAAVTRLADSMWWPPPEDTVRVSEEPPMAVVSAWSMSEVSTEATGMTSAEMHDALAGAGPGLMVVQAWEVAG